MFFPKDRIHEWRPGYPCHFDIKYTLGTDIYIEAVTYWKKEARVILKKDIEPVEVNNQLRRMIKLAFYKILLDVLEEIPKPWGILTGVRPSKIMHRLLDKGWDYGQIHSYLIDEFAVSRTKACLLEEIVQLQRPILNKAQGKKLGVSLYIGVPFCPSKCLYCSFPSYDMVKHAGKIQGFFEKLINELTQFRNLFDNNSFVIQAIYIGGGTPTILNYNQLEGLLKTLDYFVTPDLKEFTLEAGRPDTISDAKMNLAKKYNVTRISVNPQSMQQQTLDKIGRRHTTAQVIAAVDMVKNYNFKLNMDLILGLPGENLDMVEDTLSSILQLEPHNITAHTLAIKTASLLRRSEVIMPDNKSVIKMTELCSRMLKKQNYRPYYLYRQKRILADMENIGYSLKGEESWYNIVIMEEKQTIIGFGCGAASKFINPKTYEIIAVSYNPKDPLIYMQRDTLVNDKINYLDKLLALKGDENHVNKKA
ncbi:MAG: coproporphyrinogen dehydrogenase HemZ [Bacillota bacterium]